MDWQFETRSIKEDN